MKRERRPQLKSLDSDEVGQEATPRTLTAPPHLSFSVAHGKLFFSGILGLD